MSLRHVAMLAAAALLATGCSLQTTGTPDNAMLITASFDDVRNLVVGHGVRINEVQVGTVTGIDLASDNSVEVILSVEPDRQVPVGTVAQIRRTSLLGEDYVDLAIPPQVPDDAELLTTGAQIHDTRILPDLEDVASQATDLIGAFAVDNLQQLMDTAVEAYTGRGPQLNRMVGQFADLSETYAGQSQRIGQIIDDLARFGGDVAGDADDLVGVVDEISEVSESLTRQRDRIVATLEDVVTLSDTAQNTIFSDGTQANLQVALRDLTRIARTLSANAADILAAVESLVVLGGKLPLVIENDQLVLYGWLRPDTNSVLPSSGTVLDPDGLGGLLGPRP